MTVQQNKVGERKLFKLFGLFSLVYLFLSTTLLSGSFEDFKKTQSSAFSEYRDKNDLAFSTYLKAEWQEYSAKESAPLYEKQKPKSIRAAEPKPIKALGPRVNIKVPKVNKEPSTPVIPSKSMTKNKDIYIDFFGQKLGFSIDNEVRNFRFYPQNQSGIANFFQSMARSEYTRTLQEIEDACKELHLNDWGVYQLVAQLSKSIYTTPDEINLFSWFIFNKLGYDVKIGLDKKHVVTMYYSKKVIYATPSYSFDDKKFYVIDRYDNASSGRVYTYKQNYPGADKPLDLSLKELPSFEKNLHTKTLSFEVESKEYTISFSYDKNLIDFMATYPQADYETYFNAPMSSDTYEQIAESMKKYINNKHSSSALNFVLSFVQKAFKYERDQEQFSREKVMFANETLYYDKSDCEDRAILYAYLVKKLFGISVVGVKYKDHMATALYIPMKGDSVRVGARKFVLADPTYVNANVGQSMPKYKSIIPEQFIFLK